MEKTLDTSENKIRKICDALKRETLEPAEKEAERVVQDAKTRAEEIVAEGERQAEMLISDAREAVEKEKRVFHSSMEQGVKQSLEALRQAVEGKLFNEQLSADLEAASKDPEVIAKLIEAVVKAIEKEGIESDLEAVIPKEVSGEKVAGHLAEGVLNRLKDKSVTVGSFDGGAQVRVQNKKMVLDISDSALKELLSHYVRKDFRELLFK